MKVNRVILSSNNNPTYYHFWNPLSKVYKEKFGLIPTLVWIGTKQEAKQCNISDEHGDIIYALPNYNYNIPWQTTWALFWATQFFPDDTCMIMGIDQIILSNIFLDMVKDFDDDSYAMLIADAYKPNHWTHTASPSSYHIAKGRTFKKIYNFEKHFMIEAKKVYESGIKAFWEESEGRWGIDESYSSAKLREWNGTIHSLDNFSLLVERRIECERHKETPYDVEKLKQGWYSESHLCRPYTNHKNYIDTLLNNIPVYEQ